jgi:hypothetical protein
MTTPPAPLPGWYPDPAGGPGQRYWDGREWAAVAPPLAGTPVPPGPPLPPVGAAKLPPLPDKPGMSTGKKVGLGLAGTLLALAAIGSIGDSDKEKSSSSSASRASASPNASKSAPKTDVIAAPGSTVRDGKFEFKVLGVERTSSKEGAFKPEEAKGEFFVVMLQVTNVGDDARSFSASSQHLIINGNKYDASSSLSDKNWMEDVNPGLSITAPVAFDIPPGAVPDAIECHDSMFSGGALLGLPRG